jgi:acyl-CoA thioesterase-1
MSNMPCQQFEFKLHRLAWGLAFCLLVLLAALSVACQQAARPQAGATSETPAASANALPPTSDAKRPLIVAFGDSLTAGFGLPEPQSFTTLLQQRLDEKGYAYRVVNAGMSGDTSAGGLRRLAWSLEGDVKFLILELGGNDGLRGLPVEELKKNLAQMIEKAQRRGVKVILAGMEAPPNLGADYASRFRQVYRDLAKQYKTPLIPFILENVGGNPALNQADGIHPNAAGEQIMTDNVWRVLEPLLVGQTER